jgi:hypothetical protein
MAALDEDEPEIQIIDEEVLIDYDPVMDALESQLKGLSVEPPKPVYVFAKSQLFYYNAVDRTYAYDYMLKTLSQHHGEKVKFDGKTILMIINVHGSIVVHDKTQLKGTTYVDQKGVLPDFETEGHVSEHAVGVDVPQGKKVFHYKLTSKEVVYHRNYRLRDTEKLFKKLKLKLQRMNDSSSGGGGTIITGDMLATYAQLFIRSAQKEHRETVKAAMPYFAPGSIKDVDTFASVFSNIEGFNPLVECAYSSNKDVDKNQSIACFTDSSFDHLQLQESFLYDETTVAPGSKFNVTLSELINEVFRRYPDAENLIVADASCSVKRHESDIRQVVAVVQAAKSSALKSISLTQLAKDSSAASVSGSIPGGTKRKQSKRNKKKQGKSKRKYI